MDLTKLQFLLAVVGDLLGTLNVLTVCSFYLYKPLLAHVLLSLSSLLLIKLHWVNVRVRDLGGSLLKTSSNQSILQSWMSKPGWEKHVMVNIVEASSTVPVPKHVTCLERIAVTHNFWAGIRRNVYTLFASRPCYLNE